MAAVFLPTKQQALTTSLVDIGPQGQPAAVPINKVRTCWLRICNVGTADGNADVYIVDTLVAANANDGYRAKNYPVPYNSQQSAPDFEMKLVLTYGQKLQVRGSAVATLGASLETVEDDA